jgi:hypothetical protein
MIAKSAIESSTVMNRIPTIGSKRLICAMLTAQPSHVLQGLHKKVTKLTKDE